MIKGNPGATSAAILALLLAASSGCRNDVVDPTQDQPLKLLKFTASPTTGSAPLTVTFAGFAVGPTGSRVSYELRFGDDTPASQNPNVQHTYVTARPYTAVLTVRGGAGKVLSRTVSIDAGSGADVSFSAQIIPLLHSDCSGCHGGAFPSGGLDLSGSAAEVFPRIVPDRVNILNPCDSVILKKPSQTDCNGMSVFHGGNTVWSTVSPQYSRTRSWIAQGARNN